MKAQPVSHIPKRYFSAIELAQMPYSQMKQTLDSQEKLAALKPSLGVGIDCSDIAIELAKQAHPNLSFHVFDVHQLDSSTQPLGDCTFDYIVISELVNDLDRKSVV